MRYLIPILILGLFSCATAKRCAEKYPVIENTKEVLVIDTIQLKADTIKVPCPDGTIIDVPLAPPIVITETRTITKQVESMAKLKAYEVQVKKRERVEKHRFDALQAQFDKAAMSMSAERSMWKMKESALKDKLSDARVLNWLFGAAAVLALLPFILRLLKIFI